jgi:hypothetical protein
MMTRATPRQRGAAVELRVPDALAPLSMEGTLAPQVRWSLRGDGGQHVHASGGQVGAETTRADLQEWRAAQRFPAVCDTEGVNSAPASGLVALDRCLSNEAGLKGSADSSIVDRVMQLQQSLPPILVGAGSRWMLGIAGREDNVVCNLPRAAQGTISGELRSDHPSAWSARSTGSN